MTPAISNADLEELTSPRDPYKPYRWVLSYLLDEFFTEDNHAYRLFMWDKQDTKFSETQPLANALVDCAWEVRRWIPEQEILAVYVGGYIAVLKDDEGVMRLKETLTPKWSRVPGGVRQITHDTLRAYLVLGQTYNVCEIEGL